jgi:hypothetical protein
MTEQERSKRDRIERLRRRLQQLAQDSPSNIVVAGIILGILDLLADEL